MTNRVHLERDGDVAVIVIDNPPINAGSREVRCGLMAAIGTLKEDASLRAAVIIGAGNTFVAGSDLREFDRPLEEPQLPAVIAALEGCGKPVVAALQGAALGGGLELALGCDARVASPGAVLGLPEVTLGIIPGAGGTQRLPRLVGIAPAIRMICSGERITSEAALKLGIVDELGPGNVRQAAIAYARRLKGAKTLLRDREVPKSSESDAAAASEARRAGKNRPAVLAAIAAIEASSSLPFDEALARERGVFEMLRPSHEARALRYQFFAERDATKPAALAGLSPRAIRRVLVIGAGTMGAGIAIAALDAGFEVMLLEQDDLALQHGATRIHEHYSGRLASGKVSAEQVAGCASRLRTTTDWSTLSQADLVIEALYEALAVKQEVFRRIGAMARPGAVLASNTSYLDLDAIASVTGRAQDVVGLHFFISPANIMRLLEVVRGSATASDVLATALAVAKRLGKLPVVTANAFGFIGNRIYSAYRRQCEFMIEEGALPEQVDAALEAFGFAMGPFAVADVSGLDIAWRMRQSQAATRDAGARYVRIPDLLCEAGRLGRKTGAGYYSHEVIGGQTIRQPDSRVDDIINSARAEKKIVARVLAVEEIQQRALLAMVNEAALLLGEGVAQRATDVDVVLVRGYGFPPWEGGPVFWARARGEPALQADMDWLAAHSGPGFVRGDLRHVLQAHLDARMTQR